GLDRLRYLAWLNNPNPIYVMPLTSTPKQVRLNKEGKELFAFLRDPERAMEEKYTEEDYGYLGPEGLEARRNQMRKQMEQRADLKLGIDDESKSYAGPYLHGVAEEVAKEDKSVAEAIDALEVPSWYARTNVKEDFAESFVAFMDAPEKLSDQGTYRMQRALSLAGLYGKPIMRLASEDEWAKWAGMFDPPPKMLDAILDWAQKQYARHVWAWNVEVGEEIERMIEYGKSKGNPTGLLEKQKRQYDALVKACKAYGARSPRFYKGTSSKTFPLDLDGWKYLRIPASEAEAIMAEKGKDRVKVVLDFKGKKGRAGLWNPRKMQIELGVWWKTLSIDSVKGLAMGMDDLVETAHHEAMHMGQYVLYHVHELKGLAGTPPKEIRYPMPPRGTRPWKKLVDELRKELSTSLDATHPLFSREFETDLRDSVYKFIRETKKTHPSLRPSAFRTFVGAEGKPHSKFFHVWKVKTPELWKRAVKKLYQELDRQGVFFVPELVKQAEWDKWAKKFTINIGDPVLTGKFMNSPGVVVGFGTKKGDPTIIVEKGKDGGGAKKEYKLFKVRYDKERARSWKRRKKKAGDRQTYELWKLLDDIDTVGDMCKGDDLCYRGSVERLQAARWDVVDEPEVGRLYDEFWGKTAVLGGEITRLLMFDFDGTLFRGEEHTPEWWADPKPFSWGSDPVSMNPPCVPKRPGP
ncbi:MAG: hypothetical protein ACYTFG_21555, partial [Planctomycetota bacterium]